MNKANIIGSTSIYCCYLMPKSYRNSLLADWKTGQDCDSIGNSWIAASQHFFQEKPTRHPQCFTCWSEHMKYSDEPLLKETMRKLQLFARNWTPSAFVAAETFTLLLNHQTTTYRPNIVNFCYWLLQMLPSSRSRMRTILRSLFPGQCRWLRRHNAIITLSCVC